MTLGDSSCGRSASGFIHGAPALRLVQEEQHVGAAIGTANVGHDFDHVLGYDAGRDLGTPEREVCIRVFAAKKARHRERAQLGAAQGPQERGAPRVIAADDNVGCGTFHAADLLLPARGPGVTLVGARQRRADARARARAKSVPRPPCRSRHQYGSDGHPAPSSRARPGSRFRRTEMCASGATVGAGCSAGRRVVVPGRERRLRRSLQCNSLASTEGVSRGRWFPLLSASLMEALRPKCPKSAQGRMSCPYAGESGRSLRAAPVDNALSSATARPCVRWPRRRPRPRRGPPSTA